MFNFIVILLLLFNFDAIATITEYGNAKITTYPSKLQQYFPDSIALFNDKGEKFFLDKIEDKPILLVFWATWCMHCVKEMASLDILKKDFRKLPIEILPISEDYQGVQVVRKF